MVFPNELGLFEDERQKLQKRFRGTG